MNGQQQDERPDLIRQVKGFAGLLLFITAMIAGVHAVWWRKPGSMGKRYPGFAGFLGVLLFVPLMMSVAPPNEGDSARYLWWYWNGSWALYLFHAAMSHTKRTAGAHTGYIGMSFLEMLLPRISRDAAMFLEGFLSFIIGVCLLPEGVTLGAAVITAGIINYIHFGLLHTRQERTVDTAINARIEAEDFSDRVRNRLGE